MPSDHPRTHHDLVEMVGERMLPLAETGDPIATLVVQCLACEDTQNRCSDCWQRAKSRRQSASSATAKLEHGSTGKAGGDIMYITQSVIERQ